MVAAWEVFKSDSTVLTLTSSPRDMRVSTSMSAACATSGNCRVVPLTKMVVSADSSKADARRAAAFDSSAGKARTLLNDGVGDDTHPS